MENLHENCSTICTCDFYPQDLKYMKPAPFRRSEREAWTKHHSCMPKLYEEILDELFRYHTGALYGFDRDKPLDLWSWDSISGDDFIDSAFGHDAWRTLRRYFFYEGKENLRRELWDVALLVSHAGRIRNCRTVGLCHQRAMSQIPRTTS